MDVKIVRSEGRRKTVSARVIGDSMEVRAPAGMSDAELQPIVEKFQRNLLKRRIGRSLDNKALHQVAQDLNRRYFGGKLTWRSMQWVTNQDARWGSCTPSTGSIRLSHRLAEMPTFVRDYVIVHELAHLLEANHGHKFWDLVNRYPRTERARGYLMAIAGEEKEETM